MPECRAAVDTPRAARPDTWSSISESRGDTTRPRPGLTMAGIW